MVPDGRVGPGDVGHGLGAQLPEHGLHLDAGGEEDLSGVAAHRRVRPDDLREALLVVHALQLRESLEAHRVEHLGAPEAGLREASEARRELPLSELGLVLQHQHLQHLDALREPRGLAVEAEAAEPVERSGDVDAIEVAVARFHDREDVVRAPRPAQRAVYRDVSLPRRVRGRPGALCCVDRFLPADARLMSD